MDIFYILAIAAVVLIVAAVLVIFKRRTATQQKGPTFPTTRFLILCGSENGSTETTARAVYKQLLKAGETCHFDNLNNFSTIPEGVEHLLVMTSTYGLGNAPSSADRFPELLKKHAQQPKTRFSVVAFGSQDFPDFCRFGHEVNNLLMEQQWAVPLLEVHTIDDQSVVDLGKWFTEWREKVGLPNLQMPAEWDRKPDGLVAFRVTRKTELSHEGGAFVMALQPEKQITYTSGDTFAIYPANNNRERLYSIGKVNDQLQLSVRLHPGGLGSEYLYKLQEGQSIEGRVLHNLNFRFPDSAKTVVMIANGTGIAPFMGMIDANQQQKTVHLYCGFRGASSFVAYQEAVEQYIAEQKLSQLHLAFSREGNRQYVNDLLKRDVSFIKEVLENDGVLMLCGSLAMQKDITEWLDEELKNNAKPLSYYQSNGKVLMDCY